MLAELVSGLATLEYSEAGAVDEITCVTLTDQNDLSAFNASQSHIGQFLYAGLSDGGIAVLHLSDTREVVEDGDSSVLVHHDNQMEQQVIPSAPRRREFYVPVGGSFHPRLLSLQRPDTSVTEVCAIGQGNHVTRGQMRAVGIIKGQCVGPVLLISAIAVTSHKTVVLTIHPQHIALWMAQEPFMLFNYPLPPRSMGEGCSVATAVAPMSPLPCFCAICSGQLWFVSAICSSGPSRLHIDEDEEVYAMPDAIDFQQVFLSGRGRQIVEAKQEQGCFLLSVLLSTQEVLHAIIFPCSRLRDFGRSSKGPALCSTFDEVSRFLGVELPDADGPTLRYQHIEGVGIAYVYRVPFHAGQGDTHRSSPWYRGAAELSAMVPEEAVIISEETAMVVPAPPRIREAGLTPPEVSEPAANLVEVRSDIGSAIAHDFYHLFDIEETPYSDSIVHLLTRLPHPIITSSCGGVLLSDGRIACFESVPEWLRAETRAVLREAALRNPKVAVTAELRGTALTVAQLRLLCPQNAQLRWSTHLFHCITATEDLSYALICPVYASQSSGELQQGSELVPEDLDWTHVAALDLGAVRRSRLCLSRGPLFYIVHCGLSEILLTRHLLFDERPGADQQPLIQFTVRLADQLLPPVTYRGIVPGVRTTFLTTAIIPVDHRHRHGNLLFSAYRAEMDELSGYTRRGQEDEPVDAAQYASQSSYVASIAGFDDGSVAVAPYNLSQPSPFEGCTEVSPFETLGGRLQVSNQPITAITSRGQLLIVADRAGHLALVAVITHRHRDDTLTVRLKPIPLQYDCFVQKEVVTYVETRLGPPCQAALVPFSILTPEMVVSSVLSCGCVGGTLISRVNDPSFSVSFLTSRRFVSLPTLQGESHGSGSYEEVLPQVMQSLDFLKYETDLLSSRAPGDCGGFASFPQSGSLSGVPLTKSSSVIVLADSSGRCMLFHLTLLQRSAEFLGAYIQLLSGLSSPVPCPIAGVQAVDVANGLISITDSFSGVHLVDVYSGQLQSMRALLPCTPGHERSGGAGERVTACTLRDVFTGGPIKLAGRVVGGVFAHGKVMMKTLGALNSGTLVPGGIAALFSESRNVVGRAPLIPMGAVPCCDAFTIPVPPPVVGTICPPLIESPTASHILSSLALFHCTAWDSARTYTPHPAALRPCSLYVFQLAIHIASAPHAAEAVLRALQRNALFGDQHYLLHFIQRQMNAVTQLFDMHTRDGDGRLSQEFLFSRLLMTLRRESSAHWAQMRQFIPQALKTSLCDANGVHSTNSPVLAALSVATHLPLHVVLCFMVLMSASSAPDEESVRTPRRGDSLDMGFPPLILSSPGQGESLGQPSTPLYSQASVDTVVHASLDDSLDSLSDLESPRESVDFRPCGGVTTDGAEVFASLLRDAEQHSTSAADTLAYQQLLRASVAVLLVNVHIECAVTLVAFRSAAQLLHGSLKRAVQVGLERQLPVSLMLGCGSYEELERFSKQLSQLFRDMNLGPIPVLWQEMIAHIMRYADLLDRLQATSEQTEGVASLSFISSVPCLSSHGFQFASGGRAVHLVGHRPVLPSLILNQFQLPVAQYGSVPARFAARGDPQSEAPSGSRTRSHSLHPMSSTGPQAVGVMRSRSLRDVILDCQACACSSSFSDNDDESVCTTPQRTQNHPRGIYDLLVSAKQRTVSAIGAQSVHEVLHHPETGSEPEDTATPTRSRSGSIGFVTQRRGNLSDAVRHVQLLANPRTSECTSESEYSSLSESTIVSESGVSGSGTHTLVSHSDEDAILMDTATWAEPEALFDLQSRLEHIARQQHRENTQGDDGPRSAGLISVAAEAAAALVRDNSGQIRTLVQAATESGERYVSSVMTKTTSAIGSISALMRRSLLGQLTILTLARALPAVASCLPAVTRDITRIFRAVLFTAVATTIQVYFRDVFRGAVRHESLPGAIGASGVAAPLQLLAAISEWNPFISLRYLTRSVEAAEFSALVDRIQPQKRHNLLRQFDDLTVICLSIVCHVVATTCEKIRAQEQPTQNEIQLLLSTDTHIERLLKIRANTVAQAVLHSVIPGLPSLCYSSVAVCPLGALIIRGAGDPIYAHLLLDPVAVEFISFGDGDGTPENMSTTILRLDTREFSPIAVALHPHRAILAILFAPHSSESDPEVWVLRLCKPLAPGSETMVTPGSPTDSFNLSVIPLIIPPNVRSTFSSLAPSISLIGDEIQLSSIEGWHTTLGLSP